MSAFEVSEVHVHALVSAALQARDLTWYHGEIPGTLPGEMLPSHEDYLAACKRARRQVSYENAGQWGAVLLAENRRSVNHRYADDELEIPYQFREIPGPLEPVAVLKAISCYEYQSCEHPGWQASEAQGFCDALRAAMIAALPGYREAAWEITSPDDARTGRRQAA